MKGSYTYYNKRDNWGENSIIVEKGSPTTAKFAIFYAEDTDPVIFCKTYNAMQSAMKELRNRTGVKNSSIRAFALIKA